MASFNHDALLTSCVHGEAAPLTFQQELNDAISLFAVERLHRWLARWIPFAPLKASPIFLNLFNLFLGWAAGCSLAVTSGRAAVNAYEIPAERDGDY